MKRTQVQTIHVILISFILCAVSVSALSPRSINVYKNKRQNEYKLSEEEREVSSSISTYQRKKTSQIFQITAQTFDYGIPLLSFSITLN